uniref:Uncharacterized protein n=1 Tax=Anguilla anguilla TaxID=7936 RepID=A0A0E9X5L5_ANGAN
MCSVASSSQKAWRSHSWPANRGQPLEHSQRRKSESQPHFSSLSLVQPPGWVCNRQKQQPSDDQKTNKKNAASSFTFHYEMSYWTLITDYKHCY